MSSSSNKNSGAGGAGKRSKRAKKSDDIDPGSWECTVCTYRNRQEAFKCEMCDTRKGTSTRKPKLSSSVVEQHTIVQNFVLQQEQQHSQYQQAKHAARKNSAGKPQPSQSPLGTPSTPTPTRSTHSVESPSDNSFSSADHSPSTSKNPTPQPPPSPLQPVVSTPGGPSPLPAPSMPTVSSTEKLKPPRVTKTDPKPVHLRNIDKNSARSLAVTVNGTTVIITDYKLKKPSQNKVHSVKKSKSEQSEGNSFAEQTSSVKRTNGQNSRSEATPLALAAPFKKRKIGVQKDELTSVGSAGDPAERSQQVGNSNLQHAASPNTDMSSST